MMVLVTGCGKEAPEVQYTSAPAVESIIQSTDDRFRTDMIGGQDYANGSHMEVLEANPLTLTVFSSADPGSQSYENSFYVFDQLEGLTDLPIQKDINKRIREAAISWCESRPVPDSEVYTDASQETRDGAYYGVSSNFSFNYCDYLSGILNCTIDYYDPQTQEHSRYHNVTPLNFDLVTGEEFTMSALFIDGYDYRSAVAAGAMDFCRSNGLNPRDLKDIAYHSVFCLSANGLVIYPDSTYEDQGIARCTAITIPFSNFGSNWAISRSCSQIYENKNPGSFILLENKAKDLVTDSSDLYAVTAEDGTVTTDPRLSAVLSHTYPEDFPDGVFEKADAFADYYRPSTKDIESIRKSEDLYNIQTYDSIGTRIGSYCCVTLNALIRESEAPDISATRQYVYDKSGQAVDITDCFVKDFDINSIISGKMAEKVNALMDEGWTIENEIDMATIDFILGTETMTFSTTPLRRSRTVTASDGTQTKETACESLVVSAGYDEIGMENLTIFGLE